MRDDFLIADPEAVRHRTVSAAASRDLARRIADACEKTGFPR
jgi:hypothetical protein